MGFTTRRRVSIPPPLNGTAPCATAEYLNRFSGRSLTPGILRHAVGATARLIKTRAADTPKFIYGEEAARPPFC